MNTPDSVLEISPLTPKDRSDLEYMVGIGVDWVALSFVQTPSDIEEIHELISQHLAEDQFRPAVMAKIEKPSCFFDDNLEKIVELCDGIMVARGDLGVECAPEDVPLLQKEIIDTCRVQGKPVVVATQMLESMVRRRRDVCWECHLLIAHLFLNTYRSSPLPLLEPRHLMWPPRYMTEPMQ